MLLSHQKSIKINNFSEYAFVLYGRFFGFREDDLVTALPGIKSPQTFSLQDLKRIAVTTPY